MLNTIYDDHKMRADLEEAMKTASFDDVDPAATLYATLCELGWKLVPKEADND